MIAPTSRIAFCVWLVLAGTFSALAQTYTITEIGVLKGDNESSGFWLNSAGQVVGCSDTGTSNGYPCTGTTAGQHAFLWSKSAGLKDLGTMSGRLWVTPILKEVRRPTFCLFSGPRAAA